MWPLASDPLKLINFTKIFGLKGAKPKNKGHTNFYECCDLTKKYFHCTYMVDGQFATETF